ncbi:MAG: hypothetical protein LC789_00560 [Actinobacteria bacterium]|nr:hypothetical protein [Actinomycetota bacterium]MCA1719738.1 hypothetical protein [Actinomycetota bacterium]
MRHRPLATAAAAALLLGAIAGPAAARSTATPAAAPAAGSATSALNILSLALAGHAVQVGGVALTSDTLTGTSVAKAVVTPVKVDGVAYGEQTVTPENSPTTVPVVSSGSVVPAALSGLAAVTSPAFNVSTSNTNGASSRAGAASLGSLSVLGLPIKLDGTVDVSSAVSGTSALGQKEVTVKNLALPSVADLLGALGLDLSKLPVSTLTELLKQLNLTSTVVDAAQKALDDAQAALNAQIATAQAQVDAAQRNLDAAKADLASKLTALDAAKVSLTQAQTAFDAAKTASDAALSAQAKAKSELDAATSALLAAAPVPGSTVAVALTALAGTSVANTYIAALDAYNSASSLVATTGTALANAQTAADLAVVAVNAAQGAVDIAQKLVTDLQAVLNGLIDALQKILANLQPQLDALLAAITGVLDGTPLVSIDSISIQTQALVTSASAGGQTAKVVGGEIVGLHVLGTDVLNSALGVSSIDVLDLVSGTLTKVTDTVNGLTGTLSSVLSNVPSLPTLSIPAPQIGVLTKSTSTDIAGGFGLAENSVKALSVTIPAITLPAAVALPNAASLPAISGLPVGSVVAAAAVGDLVSKPITLSLATLSEQSKFRPATVAAPGTSNPGTNAPGTNTPGTTAPETPQLPRTGLPAGIALLAILFVGGALLMRRRLADGTSV